MGRDSYYAVQPHFHLLYITSKIPQSSTRSSDVHALFRVSACRGFMFIHLTTKRIARWEMDLFKYLKTVN